MVCILPENRCGGISISFLLPTRILFSIENDLIFYFRRCLIGMIAWSPAKLQEAFYPFFLIAFNPVVGSGPRNIKGYGKIGQGILAGSPFIGCV